MIKIVQQIEHTTNVYLQQLLYRITCVCTIVSFKSNMQHVFNLFVIVRSSIEANRCSFFNIIDTYICIVI